MPSERGLADAIAVCVALTLVVGPVAATDGLTPHTASTDESAATMSATNVTVTDLRVWSSDPPPYPELGDEWPLHEVFSSRADVERAMADGRLHRERRVPSNGTLVLELRMPGMAARLANASGTNETTRFLDVVYGADGAFRLEIASNPGPMRAISVLRFDRTGATTVYSDRSTDTYYVVVDPTGLRDGSVRPNSEKRVDWEADSDQVGRAPARGPYALNVTIDGQSARFFGNASAFNFTRQGDGGWRQLKPVVAFTEDDEGTVFELPSGWDRTVRAQSGQRLVALTSLDADTPVTVRVVNRSDGGPPLSNTTAATDEFVSAPPGDAYDAVLANYTVLTSVTATLDASRVAPDTAATLEVATDGRVVLRERFTVRSALTTSTSAETATTMPTATPSPTPVETPTTTPIPATTVAPTPTATAASPSSPTGTAAETGPGFGLIGALVALAVSSRRRRRG
ncbi:hypothetical protein C475_16356 [Halosimplex carlsbadense 2-9-1]|uniref:PGF-CTERM sorting domain-containing protein n=1 Tax=Halosimplex carlsbadense 2-9-1 TaxID=797114 RepID=M0CHH8_9EURY|nr:hypothetical protein [Halosimplex carlsbadense]ELZ22691.1 hypothetical protein C475_16356 [Halosimplex carlsbadense 2-9-1]